MGMVSDAVKKAAGTGMEKAKGQAAKAVEQSTPFGAFASKVISMEKQAIAANHANDLMKGAVKDAKVGTIRKIAGFVPDIAGDAANVLTLGGFGHIRNVYNKVTSGVSLDFKAARAMLKENHKATIAERTEALLPDVEDEDQAGDEMEM